MRFEKIEHVHLIACKKFLNVGPQTPNAIVYGECGRYPLYINTLCRYVKYWIKLKCVIIEYEMLLYYDNCGYCNYASSIRNLLFSHGFGFVWLFQCVGNKRVFLNSFKRVAMDIYVQTWNSVLQNSSRYNLYREFKSLLEPEKYLSTVISWKHRNMLIRLRAGVLRLKVNEGRWMGIELGLRRCVICNKGIEDEYHFILICDLYQDIRRIYLPSIYHHEPNMYKFSMLLNSKCELLINNLCRYICRSYQLRGERLKRMTTDI